MGKTHKHIKKYSEDFESIKMFVCYMLSRKWWKKGTKVQGLKCMCGREACLQQRNIEFPCTFS